MVSEMLPGGVNAVELWQILPTVSTNLLRMILVTDGDEGDMTEIQAGAAALSEGQLAESRQRANTTLRKSFLDFAGDFTASVKDEESLVYANGLTAASMADLQLTAHYRLMSGLMSREEDRKLLRDAGYEVAELAGNLGDWVDNDGRFASTGAAPSSRSTTAAKTRTSRRTAPFASRAELRLVDGLAPRRHLGALRQAPHGVRLREDQRELGRPPGARGADSRATPRASWRPTRWTGVLDIIQTYRTTSPLEGGGSFREANGFVALLNQVVPAQVDPAISELITTQSNVFHVTSTATVGKATVSIDAILDFSRLPDTGEIVHFRVR